MEINNIVLMLACFARAYHNLSSDDAVAVAYKTIEVAGITADEEDLLDALDDVWAASIKSGSILERDTRPIHPLQAREAALNLESDEEVRKTIKKYIPEDDGIKRPDHYNDMSLAATRLKVKTRKKRWIKNNK